MTLAVINLAEAMIVYGFYISQDELVDMIDPLITLLDGSKDVTTREEEKAMEAEEGSMR